MPPWVDDSIKYKVMFNPFKLYKFIRNLFTKKTPVTRGLSSEADHDTEADRNITKKVF